MKRLISIAISLAILALIYWQIDVQSLVDVFRNCDRLWMTVSLLMFVPITVFTAWRLQQMAPTQAQLSLWESNRLILAASSLNMVLPSKMGDIVKAYFMRDRGHLSGTLALSLVVFEKACDLLSLLLWCAFGLVFYEPKDGVFWAMTVCIFAGLFLGSFLLASPRMAQGFFRLVGAIAPQKMRVSIHAMSQSWQEMHTYFWGDRDRLLRVTGMSVLIWLIHLIQIWCFILALNAWAPFLANLALSPLAILVGLLPLTFAGVGTRDAALILFYQPFFDATTGAALGLLCTSRYLLPAIGGLPFLESYLTTLRQIRQPKA